MTNSSDCLRCLRVRRSSSSADKRSDPDRSQHAQRWNSCGLLDWAEWYVGYYVYLELSPYLQRDWGHLHILWQHQFHQEFRGVWFFQHHLDSSLHVLEGQPTVQQRRHQGETGLRQDWQEHREVGRGGLRQHQELRLPDPRWNHSRRSEIYFGACFINTGCCLAVLVCADGWTKSGQLCYKLETEAVDYATAKVLCLYFPAVLTKIKYCF